MKRIIILSLLIIGVSLSGRSQTLTLDSCISYALKNNMRLKEAQMKRNAAEQVKKYAFTNYFPKVNAGAMAVKSNRNFIEADIPEMNLPVYDGNPANIATATQFAYFPGMQLELLDYINTGYVSAVQPLYAGSRVQIGNKLASLGKEVSEHQLSLTTEEVIVTTEYYYWTILALKEKQKTLEGYEKLLNSLMKDVSVSYDAGLIQKSDLLKVQLKLNDIKANKLKLRNGLDLLKMTLAQHVGIKYSEDMRIADTIIQITSPGELFRDPQKALLNRNEYQMLNKAVSAEVLQKKMTKGEYLPSLALGIQGLYLDVFEQQNFYGLAFVSLSVPISDWWGGFHKMQEHRIKINIARNNMEEKSELLILQMNKAFKDINESYEQISVAESSVLQAEEHLSVVSDNYEAGILSTSDLLEAQALYQQSLDALVDAKTTYKIKQAEYLKAIAL